MSQNRRALLAGFGAVAINMVLPDDADAKARKNRAAKPVKTIKHAKPQPGLPLSKAGRAAESAPDFDLLRTANIPVVAQTDGTVCVFKPALLLDAAKERQIKASAPPPNFIIQDPHGNILKCSLETVRRHNASTTKMMLLDATMRMMKNYPVRFNMASAVEIPQEVTRLSGDLYALPLQPGKSYRASDLMIACGSFSCARATLALTAHVGRFIAGDTVKDRIDATVQHLNEMTQLHGMDNTSIKNSIGAPDKDHYSTTADMAKLALIMERDFPETSKQVMGQAYPRTVWGPRQHTSGYLRDHPDQVKFCKTGTTNAAGRCLAGVATNKGQDFGFAIFGAGTIAERYQIMTKIYNATAAYKPPVQKPPSPDSMPSFFGLVFDQFGLMPR